jgi:hypothetical protein
MRAHTQGKQTFLRELKDKNKGQKNPLVEIFKKKDLIWRWRFRSMRCALICASSLSCASREFLLLLLQLLFFIILLCPLAVRVESAFARARERVSESESESGRGGAIF